MIRLSLAAPVLIALLAVPPAHATEWRPYTDSRLGYSIDLPADGFVLDQGDAQSVARIRLVDQKDNAFIEVFGGDNQERLSLGAFADVVAAADRIKSVTYRRSGHTWFVLSGYYRRENGDDDNLIFYAKFMFSPDLSRFAAFEINHPGSRKRQFDRIVAHLEASLRAPH